MAAREYPYGKSILLNAVYDMLDRLGIPIASADSQAGILRFAHGTLCTYICTLLFCPLCTGNSRLLL